MRLAGVDIGTNSVRLLVADVDVEHPGELVTLDRRMRITRLGRGVDANRRLAPESIDRTLATLREYGSVMKELGVERVRATATSAARDAANRDEFFGAARDALGVMPELLSGGEEASLSFRGATAELTRATSGAPGPYLVVDIGGGSTEFVVGTRQPDGLMSIDVGCVRITEQFLHTDPPAPEELSEAVSVVRAHLADVARELPTIASAATAVGLAGTVTTVAAIELGLAIYDRDCIHHFVLTRSAAEDVFRTLATEPVAERRHNPGLEADRADVIVGGVIVLVTLMRTFDLDQLLVSESDILDGLVMSLVGPPAPVAPEPARDLGPEPAEPATRRNP